MNDVEQALRRTFKEEADEFWFENLEFDDRLKANVLHRAHAERARFSIGKWLGNSRHRWLFGTAAAVAMIAGVLLLFSPILHDAPSEQEQVPGSILMATGETPGTSVIRTWPLQTPAEARAAFGNKLLIPSYAPHGVPLSGIIATGKQQGKEAAKVTFSYIYGDISFLITEEKDNIASGYPDDEPVDINGTDGYVSASGSETELHWFADGVHYSVTGQISQAEAVKIAKSMK